MKTVGDFKKAGLVFVGDDKLRSETNNHDSDEICMSRCWLGHGIYRGFLEVSDCYFANKEWVISSFAWRENTGVKPEFGGLVEWVGSSDFIYANRSDELIWSESSITKWRPILNKPSVAEYETKESEIHKAWVALKGDLNNVIDDIQGSKDSILKCISGIGSFSIGDYAFCVGNFHNKSVWEYVCATQEFTNYCEKMAAEKNRMDIIGQNGNDGLHYDNTAQQVEALAVNDKPIFTQAMADAGELPPVGSFVDVAGKNGVELFYGEAEVNCEVLAHVENTAVIKMSYGLGCFSSEALRASDTRTDREKAIDEALHEWPVADKATLEMAYDFWRVGDI